MLRQGRRARAPRTGRAACSSAGAKRPAAFLVCRENGAARSAGYRPAFGAPLTGRLTETRERARRRSTFDPRDIKLDEYLIHVARGKGGKERRVVIDPALDPLLLAWRAIRPAGPTFFTTLAGLRHVKGGEEHVLPVAFTDVRETLYLHIQGERREPPEYLLYPKRERTRPFSRAGIALWFERCCERAGVVGYTMHQLRHAADDLRRATGTPVARRLSSL